MPRAPRASRAGEHCERARDAQPRLYGAVELQRSHRDRVRVDIPREAPVRRHTYDVNETASTLNEPSQQYRLLQPKTICLASQLP